MAVRKSKENKITERLDQSLISMPLIDKIEAAVKKHGKVKGWQQAFDVIIDLNLLYPKGKGLESASKKSIRLIQDVLKTVDAKVKGCFIDLDKSQYAYQHLFARLTGNQIRELLKLSNGSLRGRDARPIYKIWVDDKVEPFLVESIKTIKADAALVSYSASGKDMCWAVIDSGIDGEHLHFKLHGNLTLEQPLHHVDFSGPKVRKIPVDEVPVDEFGHGTHVAGIIAGEQKEAVQVVTRQRDESGDVTYDAWSLPAIRGVAPECKLVSLKVLDADGNGKVSNLIAALGYINQVNSYGRWPLIHGVNMLSLIHI